MIFNNIKWISVGAVSQCRNEDYVGIGDKYVFVLDGATGLTKDNLIGKRYGMSDARWFVLRVAEALHRDLSSSKKDIKEILTTCVKEMKGLWTKSFDLCPSAGIVIWRIRGQSLEYFGLGDCDALIEYKNGIKQAICEEKLKNLDEKIIQEMLSLHVKTGCSMQQARKYLIDGLRYHRSLKNKPEGYWTLDITGEGIYHARELSFPAEEVSRVFCCSDGFSQLIQHKKLDSLSVLSSLAAECQDPYFLIQELHRYQEKDREMVRVPRTKFMDDASFAIADIVS